MRRSVRAFTFSVLVLAGASWAQTESPKTAEPVLGGPKVNIEARRQTLIERDETGQVKRLDIPPAEAALKLLDLDETEKRKTQAILDERAAIIDKIVRENLLLLVNLANAGQSGDREGQRKLIRELAQKAGALRERGPLQEELASALPAQKAARLKELVKEYTDAIVRDARGGDNAGEMAQEESTAEEKTTARRSRRLAGSERRAAQAEYVAVMGRELRRSYERVVTAAVKEFDELLESLNLTPEQDAEIRRLATDQFQKTAGNPSRKERGALFAQIYAKLNAEQRKALLERVRGESK